MQVYSNDWAFGGGWFLWYGIIFLLFMSVGNWGYTYSAHRKYEDAPKKEALEILNARYAKGEIVRAEYRRMKAEIFTDYRVESIAKSWEPVSHPV